VDANSRKTLVLGLGNVLMGDEGIGVHVVREVEKHQLPAGVECLDGGTGGFILLEPMENADRIVLIDAAADGNAIGTVTRTTPRFSSDYPPTLMAHDIGVKDLLDALYMQGQTRDIALYAITIDPHQPISMDLSPQGALSAQLAVAAILEELKANALNEVGAV
jgi:hydrogenase maturation protease